MSLGLRELAMSWATVSGTDVALESIAPVFLS